MSSGDVRRRCRYVPTWGTGLENTGGLSIKESAGGRNRARMPGISHNAKRIEEGQKRRKGRINGLRSVHERCAPSKLQTSLVSLPQQEMRKALEEEAVAKKRREMERKEFQGEEEGPRWY